MKTSKIVWTIFILLFLLSSPPAMAEDKFNFFIGAGTALGFPSTVRLGLNDWEFGYLTPGSFGIDHIYRSDWKYLAWGLAASGSGPQFGAGFYGAAGMEFKLFWIITLRGEINALAVSNAYVTGGALLGLGLRF